ncbi:MAG TPA: hypothetical protein VGQ00_01240 [Candidatus Norongarragalinales archaeon]|jgi:signal peptidase I|nr:hypothetical protein [Candidatus Norongarragalinales archaeon]
MKQQQRTLYGFPYSYWAVAVLVLAIGAYVIAPQPAFAVVAFAAIAYLFLYDLLPQKATQKELTRSVVDVVIAFVAALAVWAALSFILQTSSPLDVVTSCSMVPALERGDLIVLQGGAIKAPEAQFTGSIPTVRVQKSACTIARGSQSFATNCTSGLIVNGQSFAFDKTNDIIVYDPQPSNLGLIIHRAFLKLRNTATGQVYLFTMGDNNPAADQEARIALVTQENVHGKVLFRIPYLGYLKLFLFLQFDSPPGCDTRVTR